jgi:hypothetical protein
LSAETFNGKTAAVGDGGGGGSDAETETVAEALAEPPEPLHASAYV